MNGEPPDRLVYAGRILDLHLKYVDGSDGRRHLREIVEHRPGAAVVAVDESRQVVLVRQYRPAVGASLLELPAGLIDPGEKPIDAARRELEEEAGYAADRLELLVEFYTSPGFTDELIHIFAASGLHQTATRPEDEEEIEVVRLPLEAAIEQVMQGEISDAKTVSGLLAYVRRAALSSEG
jgi:ADP-ribose pyrophosphatase